MAYPSYEQYNEAFQCHSRLLLDNDLRAGVVVTSGLGVPRAFSGGFALTYTIKTLSNKYAVRCFHRESQALERRYEAISRRLTSLRSPYFLDFQFQPKGISVNGNSYPIVKMAWGKGETLGEFIEDNKDNPQALSRLSASIISLAAFLEKERIAHGDLQTGNLMISNGGSNIQLIDYDGMFVDEIKSLGSAEIGHLNFQHPARKVNNPFDATLDRFSQISLWLAIKALETDRSIWGKTSSDLDALVFRANDFVDPVSSPTFAILSRNKALVDNVNNFAIVCKSPLDKVPPLADFIAGKNITAMGIQIQGSAHTGQYKSTYCGAYAVLSAQDYDACLHKVGDKVEVIGQVVEVKHGEARNGKPYIFLNFGNWRGRIFKISIWSEGLAALRTKPDPSWSGRWISVTGLMDPPYVNRSINYSHLSITVTTAGQMTVISEGEARRRLEGSGNVSLPSNINESFITQYRSRDTQYPKQHVEVAINTIESNKKALEAIRSVVPPSTFPSQPVKPVVSNRLQPQGRAPLQASPGVNNFRPFLYDKADFCFSAMCMYIEGMINIGDDALIPDFEIGTVVPTDLALNSKNPSNFNKYMGVLLLCFSFVLFASRPGLFLFAGIVGLFGFLFFTKKPTIDQKFFKQAYISSQMQFLAALDNRRDRLGLESFENLKEQYNFTKIKYIALEKEHSVLLEKCYDGNFELELNTYLKQVSINQDRIMGFGASEVTFLASIGIHTAADISNSNFHKVQGCKSVNWQYLIDWRDAHVRAFQAENIAGRDKDTMRIQMLVASKSNILRNVFFDVSRALEKNVANIKQNNSIKDSSLENLYLNKVQAKIDLDYLGIPTPPPGSQ